MRKINPIRYLEAKAAPVALALLVPQPAVVSLVVVARLVLLLLLVVLVLAALDRAIPVLVEVSEAQVAVDCSVTSLLVEVLVLAQVDLALAVGLAQGQAQEPAPALAVGQGLRSSKLYLLLTAPQAPRSVLSPRRITVPT